SAATWRERTASPNPAAAAWSRAVLLTDSQRGWGVRPAASLKRTNSSRVPLPFPRRRSGSRTTASGGSAVPGGTGPRAAAVEARGDRPGGGGQGGEVVLLVGRPLEGGGVGEALHQGQVQAVAQQGLLQGLAAGHGDLDLHLRPLGGEAPQGRGQEAGADGQA